jgi:hypothetical protein
MQDDPIVEEVRRVREAYAAKFNYDLEAIFQDLKRQERESGGPLSRSHRGGSASMVRTRPLEVSGALGALLLRSRLLANRRIALEDAVREEIFVEIVRGEVPVGDQLVP